MTAVDASAVCAVLLDETDGEAFLGYFAEHRGECFISPVNYWEVVRRGRTWRGEDGAAAAETLMRRLELQIAATDERQTRLAIDASRRFGKGVRGGLNMADCFAYALAASLDAPLLYKGEDFGRTDVRSAL